VLAFVTIAEPILFGRIIDSITANDGLTLNIWLWAGLSTFNIVAYVMIARGSDRLAHERRAGVLGESFARGIPLRSSESETPLSSQSGKSGCWREFKGTPR
jgi:ATP-binding cassette subfamily B protein